MCPYAWPGVTAVNAGCDSAAKIVTVKHSMSHRGGDTSTILPPTNIRDVVAVKSQGYEKGQDFNLWQQLGLNQTSYPTNVHGN